MTSRAPIVFRTLPRLAALLVAVASPALAAPDSPTPPAPARFVTGQPASRMHSGAGFDRSGGPLLFHHPTGLASDGTRFLLCDRFNNRVLVWNDLPAAWNDEPDLVLGQGSFATNDPGTGKDRLNWPGNVSIGAGGVVAVADTENDRILVWRSFPTESGQPADLSISFPAISGPGANYDWPWGVWTDGERLAAVSTRATPALLFWNTLPAADDTPPGYTVRLSSFGTPRNISTDGTTFFFVGDHNAKVNGGPGTFFWNGFPSVADQPYDWFFAGDWIKGSVAPDGRLVAGGLSSIYAWSGVPTSAASPPGVTLSPGFYDNGDGPDVVVAGGRTFVCNYNGNDVLVFDGVPTAAATPLFALGNAAPETTNTLDDLHYLQNPVLATDGTRLVATSDFDRTVWIWNDPLAADGLPPDVRISLVPDRLFPWDNALGPAGFVIAGKTDLAIWTSLPTDGRPPDRIFRQRIGSATFRDLKGVALDDRHLYVADASGTIWVWRGLPVTGTEEPFRVLQAPATPPNHLHSDGTYWTVAIQGNPASVHVYRVDDLAADASPAPWRSVTGGPGAAIPLNLPAEAITFDGALAVASTSSNAVYLWPDVADAGDPAKVVVLGQPSLSGTSPAIGADRLFMPSSLAATGGGLWVSEFKFSSRVVHFEKRGPEGLGSPLVDGAPRCAD